MLCIVDHVDDDDDDDVMRRQNSGTQLNVHIVDFFSNAVTIIVIIIITIIRIVYALLCNV